MAEYRRAYIPGAIWFFTANLAERKGNRLLVERIDELRLRSVPSERNTPSAWRWSSSYRVTYIVSGLCRPVTRIIPLAGA